MLDLSSGCNSNCRTTPWCDKFHWQSLCSPKTTGAWDFAFCNILILLAVPLQSLTNRSYGLCLSSNPNPKSRHGLSPSQVPPAMTHITEFSGDKSFSIITFPLADPFKSHTTWSYRLCLSPNPNPRGGLRLSQWPPDKTHLNNFTEEKSFCGLPLLLGASHQLELHDFIINTNPNPRLNIIQGWCWALSKGRITESMRLEGISGDRLVHPSCSVQCQIKPVAQNLVQLHF